MTDYSGAHPHRRWLASLMLLIGALMTSFAVAEAHPLGNFTINQYARLSVGPERVRVRYVIDMAEISTLQQLQKLGWSGDGQPSASELDAARSQLVTAYVDGLFLSADGHPIPLEVTDSTIALPPGAGGLPTLRLEMDLEEDRPASANTKVRRFAFEDRNRRERIGWREIVVAADRGATIFDSTVFGNGLTDEIKAYPQDMLAAPLREEAASFSVTEGPLPIGATPLRMRDGHPVSSPRDPLTELISVPEVTPWVAVLGLLVAAGLGALHAFAPGHGKTIVGAYLVGARASLRHALILGVTVTVTHTLGVLALGLITLFASAYILPEQLFPVLSFVSGAVVVGMGLSLLVARLRSAPVTIALGGGAAHHHHHDDPRHDHGPDRHAVEHHVHGEHRHENDSGHAHPHAALVHSHGGREHVHVPPGPGSLRLRSLLALGISGGLLPCPSALVVLLSAIALHRIGYGLLLVIAFSLGLAATLTAIGFLFIHAGRWLNRPVKPALQRLAGLLPAVSALVIALIGAAISFEALRQAGVDVPAVVARMGSAASGRETAVVLVTVCATLALGLMVGVSRSRRGS